MENVKVFIVGVNSKYIHSCLAAWYLKENLMDLTNVDVEVKEYTINNSIQFCLEDIYSVRPNIVAFSCYIWNIDFIRRLSQDIKKILPETIIIAGGPEVSFENCVHDKVFDFIIKKEGETSFRLFVKNYVDAKVSGEDFYIKTQKQYVTFDFCQIKSPYTDQMIENLGNKILYYESSRGCPFNCSYCLSSIQQGLSFLNLETVFMDLSRFASCGIRLIKFVDRTFNCNKKRAKSIWEFIKDNEDEFRGIVFHFEVAGDLFDKELIKLLNDMPKGQIQLEIGVQSANDKTHRKIGRVTDLHKVYKNVEAIRQKDNIHLHLDLIAGLPGETLEDFKFSFNKIYELKPHMFQLGFLKLLKGTILRKKAKDYGIVFRDYSPYEVLSTNDLSFDDIICLKGIEDILEKFYNSNRFNKTCTYIVTFFESTFDFYFSFYAFLKARSFWDRKIKVDECYEYLYKFLESNSQTKKNNNIDLKLVKELMKFDYLSSNNTANVPKCIRGSYDKTFKDKVFKLLQNEIFVEKFIPAYSGLSSKEIYKKVHMEMFEYEVIDFKCGTCNKDEINILFDYSKKDNVTGLYRHIKT